MKKILFALFAITAIVACQSNEDKAAKLIKEELNKTLYKPETYKPIETKLDSAFAPYDDPAFFDALEEMGETMSKYEELEREVKHAKSSMAIWGGPYQTAFGRNEYNEAKEDYNEANEKMEKLKEKGKKQYDKVVSLLMGERKFIGFRAVHNYRADNNMGNTLIGNSVFIIDKDFKEVLFRADVEDYNKMQDAIKDFKEQIEENN